MFKHFYKKNIKYIYIMKTIIDPLNNKRYSVFSKQGKRLLKRYVKMYSAKIGGMHQDQEELVDQAQEELVLLDPEQNQTIVDMTLNMRNIPQGVKSKTTTFLNYFGLSKNYNIEYIFDDNKLKQNLCLPGTLIKIKDPREYYQKLIIHNNLKKYKDYLV